METHPQICCCDHIPYRTPYLEQVQKMSAIDDTDEQTIEVHACDQTICVVINSGRYQITIEVD